MRLLYAFVLLSLIPTLLSSMDAQRGDLHGFWYDDYSGKKIEIKHTRKGIEVKSHGGWFNRWRRYNYMGRGLYDDCNGRVLLLLGPNRIEWRDRGNPPIVLYRYRDYGYGDPYYDDYSYGHRGRNDRRNNRRYGRDAYQGSWYCSDRRLSLNIEIYGNGIRARSGNGWVYYEPYNDHFRDRRGNRYYLDNRDLTWQSYDGKRRLKFRKG